MSSSHYGNTRGAGNESQSSNYPSNELDGPPKIMALMPSFLRGGNAGIGNINSSSGGNIQMNIQRPRENRESRGRHERSYNNNNNEYINNSMPPPRYRQSNQSSRMGGRQQSQYNNSNEDRNSSYEPESVVIQQRPIIREEELDRIDSLARDDAWSRHDEMDYNKKLQFSDDEADDLKSRDMKTDGNYFCNFSPLKINLNSVYFNL